jgi:uncharacterized protein involved in cysteine biosynthesis
MYEHRSQPLMTRQAFLRRMVRHALVASLIVLGSLLAGILGYRLTEDLAWIDALLNAAMILGGMGPVNTLHTTIGKLFAAFYALYAGVVFILTTGIIGAPFVHRLLHRFHLERD